MKLTMFRKNLIELLEDNPLTIAEIADLTMEKYKDIEDSLHHLEKSLKHMPYRLHVEPARCKDCGFTFNKEKLNKPGKCPTCKHNRITEPRISIEKTTHGR